MADKSGTEILELKTNPPGEANGCRWETIKALFVEVFEKTEETFGGDRYISGKRDPQNWVVLTEDFWTPIAKSIYEDEEFVVVTHHPVDPEEINDLHDLNPSVSEEVLEPKALSFANKAAQLAFQRSWEDLIGLNSTLTALHSARENRHGTLDSPDENGKIVIKKTERVDSFNYTFPLEKAILYEFAGGQVAIFKRLEKVPPHSGFVITSQFLGRDPHGPAIQFSNRVGNCI